MAYSKIILNGETLMDVTSDTVDAENLLSGKTATKNSGAKVTGNIASKNSSDLTVSGATVTAPAGYYGAAASKSVATTTHLNPTTAFVSSTGVFTATHAQTAGYVAAGTTTSTYNLTTQAAQTITPGTTSQYINSYRWLTGSQTIKGDANLVASNIADGVSIFGVSGTYKGDEGYKCTIKGTGNNYICVRYNNQEYYTNNDTFSFNAGDTLTCVCERGDSNYIYLNGELVSGGNHQTANYSYTLSEKNIEVTLVSSTGVSYLYIYESIIPTGILDITTNGSHNVYNYSEVSVNVGGGGYTADDIATKNYVGEMSGSNATSVAPFAFYGCLSLTSVNFPSASSIGTSAFCNCTSLTSLSFPEAKSVASYAFYSCSNLVVASFPKTLSVSQYAFHDCINLTTANFPTATYIGAYAFNKCSSLTNTIFSNVTSLGNCAFQSCANLTTISFSTTLSSLPASVFQYCYKLTSINLPNVTLISIYAFRSCSSLTYVNIPKAKQIYTCAFKNCIELSVLSFPSATNIYASAFDTCVKLVSLYLLNSQVTALAASNVFYNTPIGGYTLSTGGIYGSVFVPSSLYNSYIAANNWSLFSDRIVSV